MSFKEVMEAGIGVQLAHYLPLKDHLTSFGLLSKQLADLSLRQLVIHRTDVERAHLLEPSGRRLVFLLDSGRFCAYDLGVVGNLPREVEQIINQKGLYALRSSPMLMLHLQRLNVNMHTHWHGTPSNPEYGVYAHLEQGLKDPRRLKDFPNVDLLRRNFEQDCRYWSSSRVSGNLIFLFDRPDGSILVSEDYKSVYLVLGQAQSIGEVSNLAYKNGNFYQKPPFLPPRLHGPVVGVVIKTTLLNWEGKVVYDGLLAPAHMATQAALKKALKAYETAYNSHTIVSQLPLVEPSAPLGSPLSEQEVVILAAAVREDVRAICGRPIIPENAKNGIWIFRRMGYSEQENPNHVALIMTGGIIMIMPALLLLI